MELLPESPRSLVRLVAFVTIITILFAPGAAYPEEKVITAEATYIMGDGETPSFAEAMVLQKAKQAALEEAGTYVQSYSKVHKLDLTEEEIITIAGGILAVEILERSRTIVNDGLRFYTKIKAHVTTESIDNLRQWIKDQSVPKEYKKLQERYAALEHELASWKQILATASPGQARESVLDEIREREKAFAFVQQHEAVLFQRLVSGEKLFDHANSQLFQKKQEQRTVDHLIGRLLNEGFIIEIGDPSISAELQSQSWLRLTVPVTVHMTNAMRKLIEDTATTLNGSMSSTISTRASIHGGGSSRTQWTLLNLARDTETNGYFRQKVRDLTLVLEFVDGAVVGDRCSVLSSSRLHPLRTFYASELQPYDGKVHGSTIDYVGMAEGPIQFTITRDIPIAKAKSIRAVTGTFTSQTQMDYYSRRDRTPDVARCFR